MPTLTPDQAVADMFRREGILRQASMKAELAGEALQTVYEGIKDNFDTEQDPGGKPWEPLKYRDQPPPKLVISGKLRAAATGEPFDEGDMIQDIGDRHITVGIRGSAIPYAHVHQEGADPVPQRKFMGLTGDWINTLGDVIREAVGRLVG